jgi:hypothetical protein
LNSSKPTVSITNGSSLTVNAGDTFNLQTTASDPGGSSDPLSNVLPLRSGLSTMRA